MESKKTEKLVSALYLLTSFFSDLEPMKWRLRELGGSLVSVREKQNTVHEIMGLLTIAKNAGLVSDMNYGIIYKEFEKIAPAKNDLEEMLVELPQPEHRLENRTEPNPSQSHSYSEYKVENRVQSKPHEYLPSVEHHEQMLKDRNVRDIRAPKERSDGAVAVKKNSRQTAILSLLKKKKEIMVRDVSPFIEGVSEKTIQRELLAMVNKGILRKEGEKRWSRYSLAE